MDFERKEHEAEHGAIDKTIRQEPSHTKETRALTAQCKFNPEPKQLQKKAPDSEPVSPNLTGMPDRLKSNLESMSGFDMSSVRVHYNSPEPEKVGALAYAQGENIHLGRGQEKYLPHEGWHIAQQMQGRVKATTQYKNIYINDDPQLEKEADAMGERALTRSVPINERSNNQPLNTKINQIQNSPITQRVIKYKGVIYDNKNHNIFKLGKSEFDEVIKILGIGMSKLMGYQTDGSNIYTIDHDNKTFTKEAYNQSDRILTSEELRNIQAEKNTTEIRPRIREEHYPEKSTLYAPLDKAIIAINHDSSESDLNYIGTSGLSGCVEVIMECHTETDDGYLVSHVFSDHAGKISLLRNMLNLMLSELNHDLSSHIIWEDFSKINSSACKITLVRNKYIGLSNREEDQLFIDMRNILTDFGAHIHAIASSSVSIQITPEGAIYFNNNNPDKRIDLDYRKNDDYYFEEDRV